MSIATNNSVAEISQNTSDFDEKKSFSGIPAAEFIENVDEFMTRSENGMADVVIKRLDELHGKYKYMEATLIARKFKLHGQVPDTEKSLELIQQLIAKGKNGEAASTRFLLADQCYVKAEVPPTDHVMLWLGANVLLEYSLDEAQKLLNSNLENSKRNLSQIESDLGFLKDQLTTTEVNMARVYNWDVQRRKSLTSTAPAL